MPPIPDHVISLLDRNVIVHLATVNRDGSPQVTPIWAETDGELIRFSTAEGRVKLANLRRDSRLAMSIADPDDPEVAVVIRGRAVSIETRGWALIDRLARRYRGGESFPRVEGMIRVDVDVAIDKVVG